MSNTIRQWHRWLSIAFTVAAIANVATLGRKEPIVWLGFLALAPLLLLLVSGLYLFVLPYAGRRRPEQAKALSLGGTDA